MNGLEILRQAFDNALAVGEDVTEDALLREDLALESFDKVELLTCLKAAITSVNADAATAATTAVEEKLTPLFEHLQKNESIAEETGERPEDDPALDITCGTLANLIDTFL